jgi:hypothetical protein
MTEMQALPVNDENKVVSVAVVSNDVAKSQERVMHLVNKIKSATPEGKITPVNIIRVVAVCMATADTFDNVPGAHKKELVMKALDHYINHVMVDLSPDEKEILMGPLHLAVNAGVDVLQEARKGLYNIKKQTSGCLCC